MYLRVKNASFDNGFVKRSASCSSVGLYTMATRPDFTCDLKWWYLSAMCLVLGENFTPVAIFMHDWLSSWTLQTKSGFETLMGITNCISSIIVIRGTTCLRADNDVMYYVSATLKDISICNVQHQNMGQLAYLTTIPVCDKTWSALSESACCQPPAKSAST